MIFPSLSIIVAPSLLSILLSYRSERTHFSGSGLPILMAAGEVANALCTYDASSNWVSKTVNGKQIWYVRDVQGHRMSLYEKTESHPMLQTEVHLYGSSRLATVIGNGVVEGPVMVPPDLKRDRKMYELTNHLSNVPATVSDCKKDSADDGDGLINYDVAEVVSATDCYRVRMQMPDGKYHSEFYKQGVSVKEKDADIGEDSYSSKIVQTEGKQ